MFRNADILNTEAPLAPLWPRGSVRKAMLFSDKGGKDEAPPPRSPPTPHEIGLSNHKASFGGQPVTDTRLCQHVPGPSGIGFEFFRRFGL